MKKLNLLKTIVDYVWIFSIILYPIIIIFIIYTMVDSTVINIYLSKIPCNEIQIKTIWSKVSLAFSIPHFGLILLAFYNFKELLKNFKEQLIFETDNCLKLNKIGKLIIYSTIVDLLAEIILRLSEEIISIKFPYEHYIYLISLGLFFMVLAEVFKIGKNIKEENELTV